MKNLIFYLMLIASSTALAMLSEAELSQLTEEDRQEYLLQQIAADESGSEEVPETMTVYYDHDEDHARPTKFKNNDSSDGAADDEDVRDNRSTVQSTPSSAKKSRNNTPDPLTIEKKDTISRAKAAKLLGVESFEDTQSSGKVGTLRLKLGKTQGSELEDSSELRKSPKSPRPDEEEGKKSPRGTFSRKKGKEAVEGLRDSGSKSPRNQMSEKERAEKKEEFERLLEMASNYGKKLEIERFEKLLSKAHSNGCINLFADWCEKNPTKVRISSYYSLVKAFIESTLAGEREEIELIEEENTGKKITWRDKMYRKFQASATKDWQTTKKQFLKILATLDKYGEKIEHDLALIITSVDKADEHLAAALSYAICAYDEQLEMELCAQLRIAIDNRDKNLQRDLTEKLCSIMIESVELLDAEGTARMQIVQDAYANDIPDAALETAFAFQYGGQLENDLYDQLLLLAKKLDAETVNRPQSDTSCLSMLVEWAKEHRSRMSRFSFGLITDEIMEAKETASKRGLKVKLYDHWTRTRQHTAKVGHTKKEALDAVFGGDSTSLFDSSYKSYHRGGSKPTSARGSSSDDHQSYKKNSPKGVEESSKSQSERDGDSSIDQKESDDSSSKISPKKSLGAPHYGTAAQETLSQIQEGEESTYARLMRSKTGGSTTPSNQLPKPIIRKAEQKDTQVAQLPVPAERKSPRAPNYGAAAQETISQIQEGEESTYARLARSKAGIQPTPTQSPVAQERKSPRAPNYSSATQETLSQIQEGEESTYARLARTKAAATGAVVASASKVPKAEPRDNASAPTVVERPAVKQPVYGSSAVQTLATIQEGEESTYARLARTKAEKQAQQAQAPKQKKWDVEDADRRQKLAAVDAGTDDSHTRLMKKMDIVRGPDFDLEALALQSSSTGAKMHNFLSKFKRQDEGPAEQLGFSVSSADDANRWEDALDETYCYLCRKKLDVESIRFNQREECTHKIHKGCVNKIKAHVTACYCGVKECGIRINASPLYKQIYKENDAGVPENLQGGVFSQSKQTGQALSAVRPWEAKPKAPSNAVAQRSVSRVESDFVCLPAPDDVEECSFDETKEHSSRVQAKDINDLLEEEGEDSNNNGKEDSQMPAFLVKLLEDSDEADQEIFTRTRKKDEKSSTSSPKQKSIVENEQKASYAEDDEFDKGRVTLSRSKSYFTPQGPEQEAAPDGVRRKELPMPPLKKVSTPMGGSPISPRQQRALTPPSKVAPRPPVKTAPTSSKGTIPSKFEEEEK